MSLVEALNLADQRGDRYVTGTEGWNWWRAAWRGEELRFEFWQNWWLAPRWECVWVHPHEGVDWVPGELDVSRPPWEH